MEIQVENPTDEDETQLVGEENRGQSFPFKIYSIFLFAISIFFIFTGSFNINNCDVAPKLPLWMVVVGVFILIERIVAVKFELGNIANSRENHGFYNLCDIKANRMSRDVLLGMFVASLFGSYCLLQLVFANWWNRECTMFVSIPSFIFCFVILIFFGFGFLIISVKRLYTR